ncbi:GDSL-type esterase/lipase family protein [Falsihalocynthiibacter sp. S25ZX9]|uniref:GDSL-type esterase/lipase family protein n=1 Tax=Falsihalocynthiibacter sp. S25ZX9 TaxID=3240870 RepID=UPI00350FCAA5
MTTLLTFGDSNTYGAAPLYADDIRERYDAATRWPTRVSASLGWDLIEAGLPGRTAATPDPTDMGDHMDGRLGLAIALQSCGPIDYMTLMLGTNDVKTHLALTATEIAAHIEGLVATALSDEMQTRHNGFKLLLIAPPPVREIGFLTEKFANGETASNALPALLKDIATRHGTAYLNAGDYIEVSEMDGVHYGPEMHEKLAVAVTGTLAKL